MKAINIKGKDYIEVNERLKYFRANFKDHSLTSEIIDKNEDTIIIKATIADPSGRILAQGIAHEEKSSSYINKSSYVENCETSAWGRALGNFGIGIDTSVASYEEVSNAILNQDTTFYNDVSKATKPSTKAAPAKKPKARELIVLDIGDDNWTKVLEYVANNKTLGLEAIAKNLSVKYKIKAGVKKEISKHIK
tara:strand:- start:5222 stop:5800 length:579 start_codon:yes stop_codon:yes gene_type:complete